MRNPEFIALLELSRVVTLLVGRADSGPTRETAIVESKLLVELEAARKQLAKEMLA